MDSSDFPLSFEALVVLVQGPHSSGVYSGTRDLDPDLPSWGEVINGLLEQSIKAGVLDLSRPAGKTGEGILVLAEKSMGPHGPGVSEKVLRHAKKGLGPLVDGKPALLQVLPRLLKHDPVIGLSPSMARVLRWIRASSREEIVALDPPGGPDGFGLLAWLLKGHRKFLNSLSVEGWEPIIHSLKEVEVNWVHPGIVQHRQLPPRLLEALCESGLDLASCWKGVPAWKTLVSHARPSITRVVEKNMTAPGVCWGEDAKDQVATAAYLAKFAGLMNNRHEERRAGLAKEQRDRVLSHLISMPRWHQVADGFGRSAFFHALLANPGILRVALEKARSPSAEAEKWKKALLHRDGKGRNVWFYLYKRHGDATLTPALLGALSQVVPSRTDARGNGLLVQLLMNPRESMEVLSLPGMQDPKGQLTKMPTGEGWPNPGRGWQDSNSEDRKKALVGALRAPGISHGPLTQVPVNEETVAYKVLSVLLHSKKYCLPGGFHHNILKSFLVVLEGAPDCRLEIPPEELEGHAQEVLEEVSGNKWVEGIFDSLARAAMESHLESSLPASASSSTRKVRL